MINLASDERMPQYQEGTGMEFTNAEGVSNTALLDVLNDAFSDYLIPLHHTEKSLAQMFRQRSFCPVSTIIAKEGERPVSFWFIGRRGDWAFLVASGTRPDWRRQGLNDRIARRVFSHLKGQGVSTLSLEVFRENDAAVALYQKLGFVTTRKLDLYEISSDTTAPSAGIDVVTWPDVLTTFRRHRDWEPSWLYEDTSLDAIQEDLDGYCVRSEGHITGALAMIRSSNTVAQIAVQPEFRRQGIGSRLMQRALSKAPGKVMKVINIDASDDGFRKFLAPCDAREVKGQYEMAVSID